MTQQDIHDLIREHGGIVHGDGNIFFTNAVQFGLAVTALAGTPLKADASKFIVSTERPEGTPGFASNNPTAIRVTDRVTGLSAMCSSERSQYANRNKAIDQLTALIAGTPPPSQEYAELVLASLDALKDDAAAHIFPSDLRKCETGECVVKVCSVRVGSPHENSVPLFSREQVSDALADATHTLRMGGKPC